MELLEVEVPIGSTDRRTGATAMAGTGYIRLRRLTVSTDSGTVSGGSVSERGSLVSERVESRTRLTEKRMALPWWVWGLAFLLVVLSVYR